MKQKNIQLIKDYISKNILIGVNIEVMIENGKELLMLLLDIIMKEQKNFYNI